MCLYPKQIINKKYLPNKKNNGIVPKPPVVGYDNNGYPLYDERVLKVNVPCGQCIECRKQKARQWQVRLQEEIKCHEYNYFMTLTFSPDGLKEILDKSRLTECNAAAEYAVRHMLERYRKEYGHSLKHWLITELGHEGTERIHMHGLLLADHPEEFEEIQRVGDGMMARWKWWKYGNVFVGDYVNSRSVNYVVKYMNKIDDDHPGFNGQVLASPGIGRAYTDKKNNHELHTYRPGSTVDYYRLNNGAKIKLPKYYKNKFMNEDDREAIWREFMDKGEESIMGNNYNTQTTNNRTLGRIIKRAQETNKFLGYGDDSKAYRKKDYNITKKMLVKIERQKQIEKMRSALGMPTLYMESNIKIQRDLETAHSRSQEIIKNAKKFTKNLDI